MRNRPLSTFCQLPKPLDKVVVKDAAYHKLNQEVEDGPASVDAAFSRATHSWSCAEKLVECVLLGERSFDAFLQMTLTSTIVRDP